MSGSHKQNRKTTWGKENGKRRGRNTKRNKKEKKKKTGGNLYFMWKKSNKCKKIAVIGRKEEDRRK